MAKGCLITPTFSDKQEYTVLICLEVPPPLKTLCDKIYPNKKDPHIFSYKSTPNSVTVPLSTSTPYPLERTSTPCSNHPWLHPASSNRTRHMTPPLGNVPVMWKASTYLSNFWRSKYQTRGSLSEHDPKYYPQSDSSKAFIFNWRLNYSINTSPPKSRTFTILIKNKLWFQAVFQEKMMLNIAKPKS